MSVDGNIAKACNGDDIGTTISGGNKMINMILDDTNERMTKTIESFQRDFFIC